jgi:hypothetical protein
MATPTLTTSYPNGSVELHERGKGSGMGCFRAGVFEASEHGWRKSQDQAPSRGQSLKKGHKLAYLPIE